MIVALVARSKKNFEKARHFAQLLTCFSESRRYDLF